MLGFTFEGEYYETNKAKPKKAAKKLFEKAFGNGRNRLS